MSWDEWTHRICKLVGLPNTRGNFDATLPRPWLLVPLEEELTDQEMESLFSSVRKYLLAGLDIPVTGAPLRAKLSAMNAIESLPLLFSMRLVACHWGSYGRYWPEFRSKVLHDSIGIDVLYQVGYVFRQLWLKLYQRTDGALYYPREGQVNIKWPLAHAGLLTEDQGLLYKFGCELKNNWNSSSGILPSPLNSEVDEFWLALVDWLKLSGYKGSHLARMLSQSENIALTIAELAQRWLIDRFDDLSTPLLVGGATRLTQVRPRINLQYDDNRREVMLVVGEVVLEGHATVAVSFADKKYTLPVRYNSSEGVSRTDPLNLWLPSPHWQENLDLEINNEVFSISLLRSPFPRNGVDGEPKGALAFQVRDGRRKRSLCIGEMYYLIIPEDFVGEEWMSCIFDESTPFGPPSGKWLGYDTLLVTVRNPLENLPANDTELDLELISKQLETISEKLKLSCIADLLHPQLRPIGGRIVSLEASLDTEAFDLNNPPYFELSGLWTKPITIELKIWDTKTKKYERLDGTIIPEPIDGQPVVIEPDWAKYGLREGLYRIAFETGESCEFHLLTPTYLQPQTLSFKLSFILDKAVQSVPIDYNFQMLHEGAFRVAAFPFAPLSIRLRCGGQTYLRYRYANEEGIVDFRFEELDMPSLSSDSLKIDVSYDAVRSETLNFLTHPFVKKDDLSIEWEIFGLRLRGTVLNRGNQKGAKMVVFGIRPWEQQIWIETVALRKDGSFDAYIEMNQRSACWLAVLSGDGNSDTMPKGQPWLLTELSSNVPVSAEFTCDDLNSGLWGVWLPWAKWLEHIPHSPELHKILIFSRIGGFIKTHEVFWQIGTERRLLTPVLSERLNALTKAGARVAVDLFLSDGGLLDKQPAMTLNAEDSQRIITCIAEKSIPLDVKDIKLVYNSYSTLAELVIQNINAGMQVTLCSKNETLTICSNCGLILPCQRAWHCHAGRLQCRSLRIIERQKIFPVFLAILWDPMLMLNSLVRLLDRIADGDDTLVTSQVRPWLEKFHELFNQRSDLDQPKEWFSRLYSGADSFLRIATNKNRPIHQIDLKKLVNLFEQEKEGIELLLSWLSDWSE
jgi:hypothetical protein